jgi:outer membrane lipoprotein SlyB
MNPLLVAAAVSVIVFSLVGVAAMTGLLPIAASQKGENATPYAKSAVSAAQVTPRSAAQHPAQSAAQSTLRSERSPLRFAQSCASCGTVESIRTVEMKGEASGLGAVAGGVTGAVVGHQIGRGNGNTAMTILGAAGGAFAGNEIEKNVKKRYTHRITVRMEDGSYRTVSQSNSPAVAVGEKVRVVDGAIVARS